MYAKTRRGWKLSVIMATLGASPYGCRSVQTDGAADLKMVGGTPVDATDAVAQATVMLIADNGKVFCTGTLVDERTVITAAHCLEAYPAFKPLQIGFGLDSAVLPGDAKIAVSRRYMHAGYNRDAMTVGTRQRPPNDIAVAFLAAPPPESHPPVALLDASASLAPGAPMILAGYGTDDAATGAGTGRLRRVEAELAQIDGTAHELQISADSGQGACRGDSGGPAYVQRDGKLLLAGVTSSGDTNCTGPRHYTDVRAFQDFIFQEQKANGQR